MKTLKSILFLVLFLVLLFIGFLLVITITDFKPGEIESAMTHNADESTSIPGSSLTLLTWNLGYFGLGSEMDFFYDGGTRTRPDLQYYKICSAEALRYLANSARADIYFFQEVDLNSKRSYHDDQVKRISEVFPGYGSGFAINYQVLCVPVPVTHPLGKVKSGILTLSTFTASENTRYAFPGNFSWPVRLFMLDRCFMLTRIKHPSGHDIVLINTHNEAFDNGKQRLQQMDVLRETMLREYQKGNYVIVGGDWNLNPLGYDKDGLQTGDPGKVIQPVIEFSFLPDGWHWAFDPSVPTNRNVDRSYHKGNTPTTIIDFFVVSPNISVEVVKTDNLGFQWSDHNPVRMTIRLDQLSHP